MTALIFNCWLALNDSFSLLCKADTVSGKEGEEC